MASGKSLKICELCGNLAECEHHLIFGYSMRKLADEDHISLMLCNNCHNLAKHSEDRIHGNSTAEKLSKMLGQMMWEKKYIEEAFEMATGETIAKEARSEFMNRYGRSWIDGNKRIKPIEKADLMENDSSYYKERARITERGREARAQIKREFDQYLREESLKIENRCQDGD